MLPKHASREQVLHLLDEKGGLREGVAAEVHRETGVPEADVYGVASFYHLLSDPDTEAFVCQGLSCKIAGCDRKLEELTATGVRARAVSCLGRCDVAPAVWHRHGDDGTPVPHFSPSHPDFAIDLAGTDEPGYEALQAAVERGADWVLGELEASGLPGRGGAGFPAHFKWGAVRGQPRRPATWCVNADEAEPGTFKDREVMLRRPHRMLEGMAIAAYCRSGPRDVYIYVRGEFKDCRPRWRRRAGRSQGSTRSSARPRDPHFVEGHGAYICGEETALLEALEGRRGMPRLKPPYPTEVGLCGKPTLMHNVETLACVPAILRARRRVVSGGSAVPSRAPSSTASRVTSPRPGVYELAARGHARRARASRGRLCRHAKAFSPGGASSGFLPDAQRDVPLDFDGLAPRRQHARQRRRGRAQRQRRHGAGRALAAGDVLRGRELRPVRPVSHRLPVIQRQAWTAGSSGPRAAAAWPTSRRSPGRWTRLDLRPGQVAACRCKAR